MSETSVRKSIRVRRVTEMLDCHRSQVYRMCDTGELEWHPFGTRGRRIFLDSVQRCQGRRIDSATIPPATSGTPKKRRVAQHLGYSQAMGVLKNEGLL